MLKSILDNEYGVKLKYYMIIHMQISINIYYYLKLNNKIMKSNKTKLPTNTCLSYTPTPLMMTSSYLGVDYSSKNENSLFRVIMENYYA